MNARSVSLLVVIGIVCALVFTDTVGGTLGWVLFGIVALMTFAYFAQGLRR